MRRHSVFCARVFALCVLPLAVTFPVSAKHKDKPVVIVSPTHAKDSRGETVYKIQGDNEKSQPAIPGAFVPPKVLNLPAPQYTPGSNAPTVTLHVAVDGVVTPSGDFIDATVLDTMDNEVVKAVTDSLPQAHFKAATLDGKPIALETRIDIMVWPR